MSTWDEVKTLKGLIRERIGAAPTDVKTGEVAEDVLLEVWPALEEGEPWAAIIVRRAAREGVRRKVYEFAHRGRTRATNVRTGETFSVATHIGVKTPKNGKPASFQLRLWCDVPWPDLIQSVQDIAKQYEVLGSDLHVFSEIIELRNQYPESCNAREACALAGKDPNDFKISRVLSS